MNFYFRISHSDLELERTQAIYYECESGNMYMPGMPGMPGMRFRTECPCEKTARRMRKGSKRLSSISEDIFYVKNELIL